jgi:hypothetical protein
MKNREIIKLIAKNIVDTLYDNVREVTENEEQAIAVLSQIKNLLK